MHQEIDSELDRLARAVVDSAFTGHKVLGPGLLESAYSICLGLELSKRGIAFSAEVPLDVIYEQQRIASAYRLDFLVGDRLIVELKSVEKLLPVHEAQVLTYLRLSRLRLGLLINFNAALIRDGIRRLVI